MAVDTTLTSYILTPYESSNVESGDKIVLSYASLDFSPSAGDSYKSTSGDVFKVFVGGVRIYRTNDQNYSSGAGFMEDGDASDGTKLAGLTGYNPATSNTSLGSSTAISWAKTSNTVWEIDTANSRILLDISEVQATSLYGSSGKNVTFTASDTIIELRRSVQDLKTPAIDFSNASILTEQDLDNSAKNVFHAAQQAVTEVDDALQYSTATSTFNAYQPGTTTKKRISNVATPTADYDAATKAYADTTLVTGDTYRNDALDHRDTAEDYATRTAGTVRHFDGATDNTSDSSPAAQSGVYSSKEWSVGTQSANTDGSAKQWSLGGGSFASGTAVSGSDYSAKEHAIGTTVSTGSSKQWATKDSTAVDTLYSAKEYASGDATASGGSSKAWAIDASSPDGTSEKSAKTLAAEASASATAAKNSAAAIANSFDSFDDTYLGTMTDAVSFTADASTEFLTSNAHGLVDTQQIQVVGSDLPSGLSASTNYFVREKTTNTFKLEASVGGGAINLADNGSGSTWIYGDFTTPATSSWAKDSSTITVASNVGIRVGQVVSGTGIPTSPKPNVLSIDGTSIVISENMTAAGTNVAVTFANKGVYGTFDTTKDGPSTDNDGDALVDGMLYFNSTDNNMMVYKTTGASWIKTSASGGVSLVMHKAVASGTPTSFAASDFTPTLSYEVNNIVVWLNGVKLDATDYTATNGTTVVLGSAAAASDELVVLAFKTFEVADAVSAASGGTFGGNVSFGDNNITNVGSIALDSIVADGSSITISTDTALAAGVDLEISTTGKIKQKGSFMQSSTHQAWVLGG